MSFRFLQPSNEDDFELFCLRFLRDLWRCQTLQQYGKRGERQDGIDLIDEGGGTPFRAVQCKHHEPSKTIPPAEIEAEVAKALGSGHELDEYYILTTARKTTHSQKAIIRINRDHTATGKFKVFLWTWADIEARLSELDDATQDRVVRGDSGRGGPAICQMMKGVMSEHFDRSPYSSVSALDTELDAIKATINRHEPEVAETKLKELEVRAADKLQPNHFYQLKVLRSRLFSNRWQWEKAGRELLDAKRHMPETERARINEALGYELLGDREKAHGIATELRAEFPQSVRLLTIWVRTAPSTKTFASLVAIAEPFAKEDEELNLSLVHRAFLEDLFDDALRFARRATELDPDSPQAWFVLAEAKHSIGFKVASGNQMTLLREAEKDYNRAVQLAHAQKLPGLEAAIRFNRGKVRHLLGDKRAEADYLAAVELARPDQWFRTEYAGFLLELDRPADALRELAAESGSPTGVRLFYEAGARYERNIGDDRKEAHDLLRKVISGDSVDRWADAHILLVQWAVENNSQHAARSEIAGTKLRETNPLVYHTLCGWLLASEGNAASAKEEFRTALNSVNDRDSRDHLSLLAQALVSVGEDELALPLLQRSYRLGVFNLECRKLLDCARRLKRHDISSRVCRELREAGETDPRILQTEISVLQLYDPQEALRVAQDYLAKHPDDRLVALWQSTLALRLDRRELLVSDLSRLPTVDEVTAEGSGLVINILSETGQNAAALRYAYDAVRAHFDKEFAHGQFVAHFLRLSPHCPELRVGGTAGPGMAVCYREEREETDRWVILDEKDEVDLSLGELDRDHPVSLALVGKKVGEVVALSEVGIQPRTVTIREAFHKYIYRFRDCMNQFQLRFPGASAIQVVHVGTGDEFDPSPFVKGLTEQKKNIEMLDEQYRTQPLPLYTYSKLAGRDEFTVWDHLTAAESLGIRCFNGQRDELGTGLELARQCKTLVIDLTALHTLAQLELLKVLQIKNRTFVVAQTTFDRLQHLVKMAEDDNRSQGSVQLSDNGKLGFVEITAEQRRRY